MIRFISLNILFHSEMRQITKAKCVVNCFSHTNDWAKAADIKGLRSVCVCLFVCTCLCYIVGNKYLHTDSKTYKFLTLWAHEGEKKYIKFGKKMLLWKCNNANGFSVWVGLGLGDRTHWLVNIQVIEVYRKSPQFTETHTCKHVCKQM